MYPWVWTIYLLFRISKAILNMCVVVTFYYWIKPPKFPKFSSFVEILHSELPQKVKCMQILFSLVFSLLTKSRNRRINCGRGSGRSKIAIMQTMLATQPRRLVTRMSQYDFQNHFIRPSSWRAACFLALVFTYIVCHAWLHDWSGNESLFLVFVFSFFGTEW